MGQPSVGEPTPLPPEAPATPPSGDEIIVTSTGEEVVNAEVTEEVPQGQPVAINSTIVTSEQAAANVLKVEFYIDGVLFQTVTEPPFVMDTSALAPGTYTVTTRIYTNTGSIFVLTRTITVVDDHDAWLLLILTSMILSAIVFFWRQSAGSKSV